MANSKTKPKDPPKNPHAVALGAKGGHARARSLTAEEIREIGRKGAAARWQKPQK